MKRSLPILFFILPLFCFSQTYRTEYHIDDTLTRQQNFHAVCRLPGGDLMVTEDVWDSVPWPSENARVALVKLDTAGDVKWSKYISHNHSHNLDISSAPDGSVYVLNYSNGFYVYLVATDSTGNPIWMDHIYGPSAGYFCNAHNCLAIPGGGCYVYGHYQVLSTGESLLWAMKIDEAGNAVWSNIYDWPGHRISGYSAGMELMNDGSFVFPVMEQYTDSASAIHYSVTLIDINSSGNVVWSKSYADDNSRTPFAFRMLPDSSFFISGPAAMTNSVAPRTFLLHTTHTGTLSSAAYFDQESAISYAVDREDLTVLDNNNVLLSFTFPVSANVNCGEMMQLDMSGNETGAVRIGGVSQDSTSIMKVVTTPNRLIALGGRYTAGISSPNFPVYQPMIVKFNSIQNTFCNGMHPVVFETPDTLQTIQPSFSVLPGSLLGYMTPDTTIPFQFWTEHCVQNSIEENTIADGFSIYPDPSDGAFTVNAGSNGTNWSFTLTDVSGRIVFTSAKIAADRYQFSDMSLASGIYFVNVRTGEGKQFSKKMVVRD